jgi:hypothetical protein
MFVSRDNMGRLASDRTFYDHIVIGIVGNGSKLSRYRNKARKLTNFCDIFSGNDSVVVVSYVAYLV